MSDACEHDRSGRFCSRCGVEINPPRLTIHALVQELLASWLQRGFRQTVLGLLLAPGEQLRSYLQRDRNRLIKPISYLIIVSAFHIWVLLQFGHQESLFDPAAAGIAPGDDAALALGQAADWMVHHFYQLALLQAAAFALVLRYVFYRESGYSLAEYVIVMIYLLTQSILLQAVLSLFFLPFQYAMPPGLHLLIAAIYVIFAIGQFERASGLRGWLRAFMAYAVSITLVLGSLIVTLALWESRHGDIEKAVRQIEKPAP